MELKFNKGLNKELFFQQGFVIQTPDNHFILGQGPFVYSNVARPFALYRPDFFLKKRKAWLYPSKLCTFTQKTFYEFLFSIPFKAGAFKAKVFNKPSENFDFSSFFSKSKKPEFNLYQECFVQAKQAMSQNKFQKVVPAFSESFSNNWPLVVALQKLFCNTYFKKAYLYGYWGTHSGILGYSPEYLFYLKGSQFSTMALAGTNTQRDASLFTDAKQVKEHDYVVKSVKQSLKNLVTWHSEKKSEMLFTPLKHLRSDLVGSLNIPFDFEFLCKVLHPTSAVGGYPKQSSLNWLKQQRSQKDRSYFAAPFGFFESHNKAFCLVSLRALQWDHKQTYIVSGGGWIPESSLQKEWLELKLKRQQVKSFFS